MPTTGANYTLDTLDRLLQQRNPRENRLLTAEEAVRRLAAQTPKWFGWKTYVVPTSHITPYLNSFERALGHDDDGEDTHGWLMRLATEAATHCSSSAEGVYRRLSDIRHGDVLNAKGKPRARIVSAELAAALLMVGNLDLDRDTDIPVLPGNKLIALDLLTVRAESVEGKRVDPRSLLKYVPIVLQLSAAIIETPELTQHLQDDAPFDCLRAPTW